MLVRKQMRVYQKRAVKFMKDNPESGLFLDMGLGKTVSTLTAVSDLMNRGEVSRVLLVGPLRVVQGVWMQEAKKWEHLKHLTFSLITGREDERLAALRKPADIHLVNVENLRWLIYVLKYMRDRKKMGWPYDTLIIDESSMFKTAKAKRFVTMRHTVALFDRRHILTGTPAPNGLEDVWAQMYLVDKGKSLGSSVKRFRQRFFTAGGYQNRKYTPDDGTLEKVASIISPKVLTLKAEDWLDLPPMFKTEHWVDLPPRARKLYQRMETEMFFELENGKALAKGAAAVISKCHQMANGAVYLTDDDDAQSWQAIHDAKVERLQDIMNETGCPMLVAYYFKPDLERLRKKFPKAPAIADCKNQTQLDKLQKEWNAGKHPLMFVHPQGAGHGLNLQDGGYAITFFSLLFGSEPYRQVIERIGQARQVGKAKQVLVHHILARDTVDEALLMAQRRKFDDERGFVTAIQDYRDIKRILG